ncbi:MAG TPA: hypothetical protein VIF83_10320 [Gemmatimonadaceae bacterium]|jgi:hypothetical protein
MDVYRVPVAPEAAAGGVAAESVSGLGAWLGKGLAGAANLGEKGMDLLNSMIDRFREADGLGYDNEGDSTEN